MDDRLVALLNSVAGRWPALDAAIEWLASDYLIPVAAMLVVAWLWLAGRDDNERRLYQRAALSAVLGLGLATLIVSLAAPIIGRPRPFATNPDLHLLFYRATDPPMPAHPVAVVVALGAGVWIARRRLGLAVVSAGLVMGLARVIAGIFHPGDVAVGALIGAASTAAASAALSRFPRFRRALGRVLLATPETPS